MVGGTIIVSLCLLVLGWTKELVTFFLGNGEELKAARTHMSIIVAVGAIYAVDFAINAVQASCRSLIVDTLPIPKQQLGSAWASRMVAIGHLAGYGAGALDLEAFFGNILGDTQFKRMTVIAALALCIAVGVTCWAVEERILITDGKGDERDSPFEVILQIFRTTMNLPRRIQAICWVQFWSWIGKSLLYL